MPMESFRMDATPKVLQRQSRSSASPSVASRTTSPQSGSGPTLKTKDERERLLAQYEQLISQHGRNTSKKPQSAPRHPHVRDQVASRGTHSVPREHSSPSYSSGEELRQVKEAAETYKKEVEELRGRLKERDSILENFQEARKSLEGNTSALQTELESKKDYSKSLERMVSDLQKMCNEEEEKLQQLSKSREEKEKEIERLSEDLQQSNLKLQASEEDKANLEVQVEKSKRDMDSVVQTCKAELEKKDDEVRSLEQRNVELTNNLQRQEQKTKGQEEAIMAMQKERHGMAKRVEAQIKELQERFKREKGRLQKEYEDKTTVVLQQQAEQTKALKASEERIEAVLNKSSEHIQKLTTELEGARKRATTLESEVVFHRQMAENGVRNVEEAINNDANRKVSQLERLLKQSEESLAQVNKESSELKLEMNRVVEKESVIADRLIEVEESLEEKTKELRRVTEESEKRLVNANEVAQRQIKALQAQYDGMLQSGDGLLPNEARDKIEAMLRESEELRERIQVLQHERDELRIQKEVREREYAAVLARVKKAEAGNGRLTEQLQKQTEEMQTQNQKRLRAEETLSRVGHTHRHVLEGAVTSLHVLGHVPLFDQLQMRLKNIRADADGACSASTNAEHQVENLMDLMKQVKDGGDEALMYQAKTIEALKESVKKELVAVQRRYAARLAEVEKERRRQFDTSLRKILSEVTELNASDIQDIVNKSKIAHNISDSKGDAASQARAASPIIRDQMVQAKVEAALEKVRKLEAEKREWQEAMKDKAGHHTREMAALHQQKENIARINMALQKEKAELQVELNRVRQNTQTLESQVRTKFEQQSREIQRLNTTVVSERSRSDTLKQSLSSLQSQRVERKDSRVGEIMAMNQGLRASLEQMKAMLQGQETDVGSKTDDKIPGQQRHQHHPTSEGGGGEGGGGTPDRTPR